MRNRLPARDSMLGLGYEVLEERRVMAVDSGFDFSIDYSSIEDNMPPLLTMGENHDQTGWTEAYADYGFTGAGQTVVVIDSGIAYDHVSLGGGYGEGYRVVGGWDFAENDADPYDDGPLGSHGTHVAGIIGNTSQNYSGVATGVDLVALRVFDDNGNGKFSWVEDALQWVLDNKDSFANPITTINLSLGTNWNSESIPSWATLENEFKALEDAGIFISVAAGNSFTSYNETGLSYPAASQYVVPVASLDADGSISSYSQRSDRAIAAPGRSIWSTVPDYRGNQNGIANDFVRYSGTSMAAPYVAGASVILREAYAFAGRTNVTQDELYNLMRNTADTVYDPITGQSYFSLNMERAIETIMPSDEFGSSMSTAHNLGSLTGTSQIAGLIGKLGDQDYFSFTAASSGQVTLSVDAAAKLNADWLLGNTSAQRSGNNLTFNVVAGQKYTFGVEASTLGNYTVNMSLESNQAPVEYTNWGTVGTSEFDNIKVSGNGYYSLTARQTGILTVEAFWSQGKRFDFEIYNAQGQKVGSTSQTDGTGRMDLGAKAGQQYFLHVKGSGTVDFRVTNALSQSGSTWKITGTADADQFSFSAATRLLTINGTRYTLASSTTQVEFDGRGGNDSVSLFGTSGNDKLTLRPGEAAFTAGSMQINVTSAERIAVTGGGGKDQASVYDTSGNDVFIASDNVAYMIGGGFYNSVYAFNSVAGFSTGGSDYAELRGTSGDDMLITRGDDAQLSLSTGNSVRSNGFAIAAIMAGSGNDRAYLYGTDANESLVLKGDLARISGAGYSIYAKEFESHRVDGGGGFDTAYVQGSDAAETLTAHPTWLQLTGGGNNAYASGFENVYAYMQDGNDRAYLYGSSGTDTFNGYSGQARLVGAGYMYFVKDAEMVYANGQGGASDVANLYDSLGNDSLDSRSGSTTLSGAGFSNTAANFTRVNSFASGGYDVARFEDSSNDDYFTAAGTVAELTGSGYSNYGTGFDEVLALSTLGKDRKDVAAVDFLLAFDGGWQGA